jgi:hypothetical protein
VVFSVFSHHHFVGFLTTFGADTSLPLMTRRNAVCTRCVWSPKVYRGGRRGDDRWRASFVACPKGEKVRFCFIALLPAVGCLLAYVSYGS